MRDLSAMLLLATLAGPALGQEQLASVTSRGSDAQVVSWAPARFTEAARRARVHGTVQILVSIDRDGKVVGREIVKDLPMGLGKAGFEASRSWRFDRSESAERHATLEYVFVLDEDSTSLPRFEFEAPRRVRVWSPSVLLDIRTGCVVTGPSRAGAD